MWWRVLKESVLALADANALGAHQRLSSHRDRDDDDRVPLTLHHRVIIPALITYEVTAWKVF